MKQGLLLRFTHLKKNDIVWFDDEVRLQPISKRHKYVVADLRYCSDFNCYKVALMDEEGKTLLVQKDSRDLVRVPQIIDFLMDDTIVYRSKFEEALKNKRLSSLVKYRVCGNTNTGILMKTVIAGGTKFQTELLPERVMRLSRPGEILPGDYISPIQNMNPVYRVIYAGPDGMLKCVPIEHEYDSYEGATYFHQWTCIKLHVLSEAEHSPSESSEPIVEDFRDYAIAQLKDSRMKHQQKINAEAQEKTTTSAIIAGLIKDGVTSTTPDLETKVSEYTAQMGKLQSELISKTNKEFAKAERDIMSLREEDRNKMAGIVEAYEALVFNW